MTEPNSSQSLRLTPKVAAEARSIGEAIVGRATREIGRGEHRYDNHGPDVARYTSVVNSQTYGHAWCAAFASYILRHTAPKLVQPSSLAKGLMAQFQSHGAFHPFKSNYNPQPGDLLFMDRGGGWKGHVGFITKVDADGTIHTIEGNKYDPRYKGKTEGVDYLWNRDTPDQVRAVIYSPNDPERAQMLGYGSVAELAESKHVRVDGLPGLPHPRRNQQRAHH